METAITHWKTPVVVRFNKRDYYNGSNTLLAYHTCGTVEAVLFDLKASGQVWVLDADGKTVYDRVYVDGERVK